MRERLLVLNGQRIVQAEKDGAWTNQKVDKAGGLKPGIYNLYLAHAVDKQQQQTFDGVIVHVDSSKIYQQIGKNFVVHSLLDFGKVPEIGSTNSISYSGSGKANVVEVSPKLTRKPRSL